MAVQSKLVHLDTGYRNLAKVLPFLIFQNIGSQGYFLRQDEEEVCPQVPEFTTASHNQPRAGLVYSASLLKHMTVIWFQFFADFSM